MSLKQIQHLIDNPNDCPDVPRATKEYLQVVLNHSYVRKVKVIQRMRDQGLSEAFIAGFLEGLEYASDQLDVMEMRAKQQQEEG